MSNTEDVVKGQDSFPENKDTLMKSGHPSYSPNSWLFFQAVLSMQHEGHMRTNGQQSIHLRVWRGMSEKNPI